MRLKPFFAITIVLAAAIAAPASAGSRAMLRLIAYVPVKCEARIVDGRIDGSKITVSLSRTCNTGHLIHVAAPDTEGPVSILEVGSGREVNGSSAVFVQPERYVDGLERFIVDCGSDDPEHVVAIARGLRIGVEVA